MKGPQEKGITRDNLKKLYVDDHQASMEDVADTIGVHRETIRRWLHRFNLPIKKRSRKGPRKEENALLGNKEWLAEQYKNKTGIQIAQELGTTEHDVWYWLERHGLNDMSRSESIKAGLRKSFPEGRFGEDASNWRGGVRKSGDYVFIYAPDHPRAGTNKAVQEHILVMEEHLGRYLEECEVVHHKNGIKDDNRLENLEVVGRGHHVSNHFQASHEVLKQREYIKQLEAKVSKLEKELAKCKNSK